MADNKIKVDHSKPLSEIRVLEILRKYSEAAHPLKQSDIIDFLAHDYGIEIERKAVGRILTKLEAAGYPLERTGAGVYLESEDFEESELRFLIDAVLFSRHVSSRYARDLIEKIKMLGNVYFRQRMASVYPAEMINRENNPDLFFNVDAISDAITRDRKITFFYNGYGTDKKLHPKFCDKLTVSPYQLVAAGNHYYLVGKYDGEKKSAVVSYRVEKMSGITVTDEPRDKKNGKINFDLNAYLNAHPYMYTATDDNIEDVTLKLDKTVLDDFIDAFGLGFSVIDDEDEKTALVRVKAGRADMIDWLKRFGEYAEVVSPSSLRSEMSKYIDKLLSVYNTCTDYNYRNQIERAKKYKPGDGTRNRLYLFNVNLSNRTDHYGLSNVERAFFCDNKTSDFSFLSSYVNLVDLDVEENPVNDLSVIAGCKKIKFLRIMFTKVLGIGFITKLPELVSLTLHGNPIQDFSPVYECKKLKTLKVDAATALKLDEKALAGMNGINVTIYETLITARNNPRRIFTACKTKDDWDKLERIITNYSDSRLLAAFTDARFECEQA